MAQNPQTQPRRPSFYILGGGSGKVQTMNPAVGDIRVIRTCIQPTPYIYIYIYEGGLDDRFREFMYGSFGTIGEQLILQGNTHDPKQQTKTRSSSMRDDRP